MCALLCCVVVVVAVGSCCVVLCCCVAVFHNSIVVLGCDAVKFWGHPSVFAELPAAQKSAAVCIRQRYWNLLARFRIRDKPFVFSEPVLFNHRRRLLSVSQFFFVALVVFNL